MPGLKVDMIFRLFAGSSSLTSILLCHSKSTTFCIIKKVKIKIKPHIPQNMTFTRLFNPSYPNLNQGMSNDPKHPELSTVDPKSRNKGHQLTISQVGRMVYIILPMVAIVPLQITPVAPPSTSSATLLANSAGAIAPWINFPLAIPTICFEAALYMESGGREISSTDLKILVCTVPAVTVTTLTPKGANSWRIVCV